jgi:Tol biopolymer transport system component
MPEDTHEDIRRRLFEAAWDEPAFAPAPERAVPRARRRAGVTISGMAVALMTVAAAIVVSFGSAPLANRETGIDVLDDDHREYIVDVTTGERTEYGSLPSSAWLYDISPDGSKMTFIADTSGRNQVWVMDMDGTDLRQLSDDPYEAIDPDWSHDSSSIVFVGFGGSTERGLFVVDVESGLVDRVHQDTSRLAKAGDVWNPEWSPDGDVILYHSSVVSDEAPVPGTPNQVTSTVGQVRSVDIETGRVGVLTGGGLVDAWDATWSNDGRIAFMRARLPWSSDPNLGLWMMSGDASGKEMLRSLDADGAWSPSWSPDGRQIAYVVSEGGRSSIHVLDLASGEDRAIARGEYAKWIDPDTLLVQESLPH